MFCCKCGHELKEGHLYCANCGAKIVTNVSDFHVAGASERGNTYSRNYDNFQRRSSILAELKEKLKTFKKWISEEPDTEDNWISRKEILELSTFMSILIIIFLVVPFFYFNVFGNY